MSVIMSSMRLPTLEAIFGILNDREVRDLVAGGVAVNAHGYQRMTQDPEPGENVEVFSLTSDVHRETTIDLFVPCAS